MSKIERPSRSSTGHHFGVAGAIRQHVPLEWGKVKEPSQQDIDAYNARQRAKLRAEHELANVLRTFSKLKVLAKQLRSYGYTAAEVLSDESFKADRRRFEEICEILARERSQR